MDATFPIIDVHCHPSLKVYLCNTDISQEHRPKDDFVPGGMHVDLPGMQEGNVKVIISYQYVPEAGLRHMRNVAWLATILRKLRVKMIEKFESGDDGLDCFEKAMGGINLLNGQVAASATAFNVTSPKSLSEFDAAMADGKTIILHGLEGGHHLGKNLDTVQAYIDNLQQMKSAGVCVLTLAHFFQNSLCDSAGGIPPSEAHLLGYKRPVSLSNGLTEAGRAVVGWCQDNGMIIDLVHSTIETRRQVYAILDERKRTGKTVRPFMFSHTGVRTRVEPRMISEEDRQILPDVDDMIKVKEHGGILGLILMNYWLSGEEDNGIFAHAKAIDNVIGTMKWIRYACTDDVSNIAIGTDLDGFTQVPGDVKHIRFIGLLRYAIVKEFGAEEAAKICSGNALRVIRANLT